MHIAAYIDHVDILVGDGEAGWWLVQITRDAILSKMSLVA